MSRMNHKGPENTGPKTGRKLGLCTAEKEKDISMFGKGMGKCRNSGGGIGLAKRLKYNLNNRKTNVNPYRTTA